MNYAAVVFYEAGNPEGLPVFMWRDFLEMGGGSPCPAGYVAMTLEEWAAHRAEYDPQIAALTAVADLAAAKLGRRSALSTETRTLIESVLSDGTQRTLTFLYAEAQTLVPPLPVRSAHINLAWVWIKSVLDALYACAVQVEIAATVDAVVAVHLDEAALLATAPAVSISSARAIMT